MRSIRWFQIGFRFKKLLISGIVGLIFLAASLVVLLKDLTVGPFQWGASLGLAALGIVFILDCFRKVFIRFINFYPFLLQKGLRPIH